MTQPPLVGIIANPASGKDIRRLVAHGSTFDNNEKINIVRRALVGLAATGVEQVAYLPDGYAIVARAAEPLRLALPVEPLPMAGRGDAGDSLEAARRLAELGAGAIITLGGDGTNRVVAKGCGDVPLVAVSTGTNNVFPRMIEGTLAGLAAGLVATGIAADGCERSEVVEQRPRLEIEIDGTVRDIALVDVATSRRRWVGARALGEPSDLSELVLSRIAGAEIGMASLGGLLFPDAAGEPSGAHLRFGEGPGSRTVLAPLAPGMLRLVGVEHASLVEPGSWVELRGEAGTIALDGEREIEVPRSGTPIRVGLNPDGPWVVDVEAALRAGAAAGLFWRTNDQ